jgi:hypothetical protein
MSKLLNTQKNALQMLWNDVQTLTKQIQELPKSKPQVNSALIVKGWSKVFFVMSNTELRLHFNNLTSEIKAKIRWSIVLDNTSGIFVLDYTSTSAMWIANDLVFIVNSDYNNIPVEIKLYV